MSEEEKTSRPLTDEPIELRERIARLKAQNRRAEKNLKACQQQLQQAQKMETLGTLVAGIGTPGMFIFICIPMMRSRDSLVPTVNA